MKLKIIILLLFSTILCLSYLTKVSAQVFQNNIGKLKTGMTVNETEEVTGRKIILTEGQPPVLAYNDLKLEFTDFPEDDNSPNYELTGITTTSKKFKTDSGIGMGCTLKEVRHKYRKYRNKPGFNVYEYDDKLSVFEMDYMNILTFTFKDNKVVEIKVWTADSW